MQEDQVPALLTIFLWSGLMIVLLKNSHFSGCEAMSGFKVALVLKNTGLANDEKAQKTDSETVCGGRGWHWRN